MHTSDMPREQMGHGLPAGSEVPMARDQIAHTRSSPIVLRNNPTPTARPPQPGQSQKMPAFSGVRVNPLPQFGQVNMALKADYFGSKSVTSDFSSFNSFSVAAIFTLLKSLSGTPWTISKSLPLLRTG
jgi:hypothetical protein